MAISEQELAGLSDEERAALDSADDGDVTDDLADDDNDVEDTAAVATESTPEATEAPVQAQAEPQPTNEQFQQEFVPRYEVPGVDNFEQKMQELDAAEVDLRKKLAEGDVTIDEYDAEKSRINKEVRQLERAQHEAEMYAKMNQQVAAQKWQWEQEQFFSNDASALYKDPLLMSALDTAVKSLANDPANVSKPGAWFLKQADAMVRERFGQNAPAQTQQPGKPSRTPDLASVPKTLSNMPTAELPDTGSDEFSALDKLSGIELEKRLAKMSPDEMDRYLRAAA